MPRKQSGFTLIELVIVVVILGILAAVALPRFINFTTGSREAVLSSLAGALTSANTLVYAQAAIQGSQNAATAAVVVPGVDVDGDGDSDAADTVPTAFGYLRDNNAAAAAAIAAVLQVEDNAALGGANAIEFQSAGGVINIGYDYDTDGAVTDDDCHIIYAESTGVSQAPVITFENTSC